VSPFSGEPAVVVVEPPDHGTDVEGGVDGVQLKVGTGDLRAIGNDSARDYWPQELRALLEAKTFKATTQRIEEYPSCCVELWWRKKADG
jgi:hypothetical protein